MPHLPLILTLVSLICLAQAESHLVYLSDADGIHVFQSNPETGLLTPVQQTKPGGLIAIAPDKTHLYARSEAISTHRILPDGTLEFLGESDPSAGGSYLDIDATGRFLAASDYGGGYLRIWKIDQDRLSRGGPVQEIALEKQVHSSVFSPGNRFLLVPATGPNRVFQFHFDATTGLATPNDPPTAPGPTGTGEAQQPRHIRFHPSLPIAYTTLERELPGVGVWTWDTTSGQLEVIQNIVTLPDGFTGSITTADLHLTPDARFLYVSNRDLTDRSATSGESSLVGFRVDPDTGRLTLIGHTPCEHIPRSFAIDEAGRFLYVAGQKANLLGAYRIDLETGALNRVQQIETGSSPSWVKCLTLPPNLEP